MLRCTMFPRLRVGERPTVGLERQVGRQEGLWSGPHGTGLPLSQPLPGCSNYICALGFAAVIHD